MRKIFVSISFFFILLSPVISQNYHRYFTDKACRVDFHFVGNSNSTDVYLHKIKEEPFWGGRHYNLNNKLNLGEYRFQVLDSVTNKLIYTDGFSSLFFEWQSTAESKFINKSFEHSIQFPFPRFSIKVKIEKRINLLEWEILTQFNLSPDDKLISRQYPKNFQVKDILKSTSSDKAVDIAIIAEGYTISEQSKFFNDARRLTANIFTHEPFTVYKKRINVYAVAAISEDSGISKPHENEWRNTAVGAHFYTFYEPRYLTSPNNFSIRDIAANVPYDAIYVLANTATYGGGGIYNLYAVAASDSEKATKEVIVHEFGHSFAGLGDEYFKDKPDVLDDMYDTKNEPWEPNITSLVQFETKWKNKLAADTQIPTIVNDSTKKIKIGVFEGGGYLTKGMYRPAYNCRMRTNDAKAFCVVCEKAIEKMIRFLTEEE